MQFDLNPKIDLDAAAKQFADTGVGTIEGLVAKDQAEALLKHIQSRHDWRQVINSGDKVIELDRSTREQMTAKKREQLDQAVYGGGRYGFQYRYETLRVPDRLENDSSADDPILSFARFMRSPLMIDVFRQIVGNQAIVFSDAQATAYGHGDFLTEHDDDVAGKNRAAAYTFGLNEAWRPEWGGLLLFHAQPGKACRAISPGFNLLSVFRVPQPHSVSMVTPLAPRRRYSITGWARTVLP